MKASKSGHLLVVFCMLVILLSADHPVNGCPDSCTCLGGFVTCFNFTESTLLALPVDSDTVVLNGGNIHSFPVGFLSRLPDINLLDVQSSQVEVIVGGSLAVNGLQQLAITDCTIGSLGKGAFSQMQSVNQLMLSESRVGEIQVGAFDGLSEIDEFSISSNQIGHLQQHAFANLSSILAFSFCKNNISSFAPAAFGALKDVRRIDISYNRVYHLEGKVSELLAAPTFELSFHSNQFPCRCQLLDMFPAPYMFRFMSENWCIGAGSGGAKNTTLLDLAASGACKGESTVTGVNILTSTSGDAHPLRSSREPEFAAKSTTSTASYTLRRTVKRHHVITTPATSITTPAGTASSVRSRFKDAIHQKDYGMGNTGSRLHQTLCALFVATVVASLVADVSNC